MYIARKMTNSSFPDIGERFGGKDHTTVMHNVRKVEEMIQTNLDMKAHVESLERQLEQLN
jgi:chromosomal replication initiator protein